jgi:4-diphosphocytidyl-2-C-methyl-D-erythritol kinase
VPTNPDGLVVSAPAKINLFLHVGDKRADGFHALESLVVFAGVGDTLSFAPADGLSLSITGPFAAGLDSGPDNLVMKAARLLAERAAVTGGARIVLTKNLPVASGIGGGSADAAATLRGLVQLWKLKMPPDDLRRVGEALGSDVPVCVDSMSAWMEGRGEKVTILDGVPEMPMVMINPGVAVATGKIFAALKGRRGIGLPLPPTMRDAVALVAYLKSTANDLEAPACEMAPVIGTVLSALTSQQGALLARMSGSGATCFALFGDIGTARDAATSIRARHKDWWVVSTAIR